MIIGAEFPLEKGPFFCLDPDGRRETMGYDYDFQFDPMDMDNGNTYASAISIAAPEKVIEICREIIAKRRGPICYDPYEEYITDINP